MAKKQKIIVVTGPTATGKTALGVKLAARFGGEIISADSRQVYRGMDIGAGKDLEEYAVDGVTAHLIDIAEPNYEYNLMEFCRDAWNAISDISRRGALPLLCGGTALYIDAILSGYELPGAPPDPQHREQLRRKTPAELAALLRAASPELHAELKDVNNKNRLLRALEIAENPERKFKPPLSIQPLLLGVYFPRKIVHERIAERLDRRLEAGMVEEVERLHEAGVSWERLEFFGLEYRCVAEFLQGRTSFEEMRQTLLIKIRQFARRQDIWFRKLERAGRQIHWIPGGEFPSAVRLVEDFLHDRPLPQPEIQLKNIDYGRH